LVTSAVIAWKALVHLAKRFDGRIEAALTQVLKPFTDPLKFFELFCDLAPSSRYRLSDKCCTRLLIQALPAGRLALDQ
jgi:hypothetical protein